MLDWDDLKTFLAIARPGTLSAAARTLRVSQTTMGRRLDHLQGRAGATLLERTPTGFRLTPTGAAVMGDVERMEEAALTLERTIAVSKGWYGSPASKRWPPTYSRRASWRSSASIPRSSSRSSRTIDR